MNKSFLVALGALAFAGAAQAQDNTVTSGPFRFSGSAGPVNGTNPFRSNIGVPDSSNPIYQSPLLSDRLNASESGGTPNVGAEGGGTPMSRGGVNDTLTSNGGTRATFSASPDKPKPAKRNDKTADKVEKPKP
jgi:hypothetical protein